MRNITIDEMLISLMDVEKFKLEMYLRCPLRMCRGRGTIVQGQYDDEEEVECPHVAIDRQITNANN